ncbi:MAG TPA: hypothetical protein VFV38_10555 [Ktedonobacteraceae bacterium]|nr:hypothetical protein [Ktedonobacteraceae bacterium]
MIAQRRSIFRDKALKHYTEGRKKDVLPNFSSVPASVFGWLLLGLLIATGLVAAYTPVPVYVAGAGIVLSTGNTTQTASQGAMALAFFQPKDAAKLHAGQQVRIQIGTNGSQLNSAIEQIEPGMSSPAAALARYGQKVSRSSQAGQQVVVAQLRLGTGFPVALYAGNVLAVEVNAGTQSLFSALSGLGNS